MYNHIRALLPYKSSFLFVDEILSVDESGVKGEYTLKPGSFFYEDHFADNPVTPGVIITEIMAQIGLVVLGIHLIINRDGHTPEKQAYPLLTATDVEFFKMVLPGEKVTVISQKQFFRWGKLKCRVQMQNEAGEIVAKGIFSGIIMGEGKDER
jgi:3-hydroxyacyl-[acyl-carrier-protein] dehydratase